LDRFWDATRRERLVILEQWFALLDKYVDLSNTKVGSEEEAYLMALKNFPNLSLDKSE
jgi:hypothetical protein